MYIYSASVTDPADVDDDLDPALVAWIVDVTGTEALTVTRNPGGASRAGYAVDARLPDGTMRELWLRTDPGFGPQSATRYSLRREAAVYRALRPTPMLIADLVAVHPDLPAFLMRRVTGESRFAQIDDPAIQASIAREFFDQLAALHRLDPSDLELPELGSPGDLADHVREEIGEWEQQYAAAGGGVPAISLAGGWLRANIPADGGWPVVLVQGDTGPGNFMFDDGRLVAVTDWELAHWGDLHDDLAWVLVRDTLERFPDLEARFTDYEQASGFTIDGLRLRYFRVLAQYRATIGTLAGLRSRDSRGEIAWQLIYNTLHTRLLTEALAEADGRAPEPPLTPGAADGEQSWVFDVALDDLRDVVLPALTDQFAATRTKGLARLLKYLREADRLGPGFAAIERAELGELLGRPVPDLAAGRRELCAAIEQGALTATAVLPYCLRQSARETAVARGAMGSLADRHFTSVRQLREEGPTP
jgi:aminoglycoside phosphotransferase (APT) family kinase protein